MLMDLLSGQERQSAVFLSSCHKIYPAHYKQGGKRFHDRQLVLTEQDWNDGSTQGLKVNIYAADSGC